MKVLHVFNHPRSGGGSVAATRATIAALEQRGVTVEVFTRDSRTVPATLTGRLRTAANALYARNAVREFAALLDQSTPDLVHINELFPLISPWILPECTRRGVPVVMTVDDYHLTCPARNHFRNGEICTQCLGGREYRGVLNNCRQSVSESIVMGLSSYIARRFRLYVEHVNHYVCPSEFTRQWIVEHLGVATKQTTTIPHFIDIPDDWVDPAEGAYIAFAGRFVPEKGIDVLLEAARISDLPVRLSRNQEHFVTIDLPPGVEVVVTRDRDELAQFYRGARMLVVPSVWFESFGLVGAESMSHGVPIIVSDIGAVADLVEDGVDGLRFRTGDAHDLAAKMRQLWNDPDLCRRLGHAARRKAVSQWTAEQHALLMMRLYEKVISETGAPSPMDSATDMPRGMD